MHGGRSGLQNDAVLGKHTRQPGWRGPVPSQGASNSISCCLARPPSLTMGEDRCCLGMRGVMALGWCTGLQPEAAGQRLGSGKGHRASGSLSYATYDPNHPTEPNFFLPLLAPLPLGWMPGTLHHGQGGSRSAGALQQHGQEFPCCWGSQWLAASWGGDPSPEQHGGTAHCGVYVPQTAVAQLQYHHQRLWAEGSLGSAGATGTCTRK